MGWFSRSKSTKTSGSVVSAVRRDLVVPMMSGQAWMDANEELFAQIPDFPAGEYPAATAVTDGLYVTYAVDPGPSWEVVSKDSVRAFGGIDLLKSVALANLRNRGDIHIQGAAGRFVLTVPDELDLSASLLLDPDRWRSALGISGDIIVGVPTRTVVWACSADDHESVGDLARITQHGFAAGEGKPVAPTLFRLTGTALSPHSQVV